VWYLSLVMLLLLLFYKIVIVVVIRAFHEKVSHSRVMVLKVLVTVIVVVLS
jgi:hypothetical protein